MENGALRAERVCGMTKSDRHLAQFNIARIRYRLDDPRMTEFVRREEWFEPIKTTLVFWWIPVGHRFEMPEGVARLDYLIAYGPSDYAFGWKEIAGAKLWKLARGDERSEHAA